MIYMVLPLVQMEDRADPWKVRYVQCHQQFIIVGEDVGSLGKSRGSIARQRDDLEVIESLDSGYRCCWDPGVKGHFDQLNATTGQDEVTLLVTDHELAVDDVRS